MAISLLVDVDEIAIFPSISFQAGYYRKILEVEKVFEEKFFLPDDYKIKEDSELENIKLYLEESFLSKDKTFFNKAFVSKDFIEFSSYYTPLSIISRYSGDTIINNEDDNDFLNDGKELFESNGLPIKNITLVPYNFDYSNREKCIKLSNIIFDKSYVLITKSIEMAKLCSLSDCIKDIIFIWQGYGDKWEDVKEFVQKNGVNIYKSHSVISAFQTLNCIETMNFKDEETKKNIEEGFSK